MHRSCISLPDKWMVIKDGGMMPETAVVPQMFSDGFFFFFFYFKFIYSTLKLNMKTNEKCTNVKDE